MTFDFLRPVIFKIADQSYNFPFGVASFSTLPMNIQSFCDNFNAYSYSIYEMFRLKLKSFSILIK